MVSTLLLLQAIVTLSSVSCDMTRNQRTQAKHPKDYPDQSLWKKEYESELKDALLSTKGKDDISRNTVQRTMSQKDEGDIVIEKLVDSIAASEKYLKKVDNIDFRLNRLDIEVHEKTNTIMKRLSEILKSVRSLHSDTLESTLESIRGGIVQLKQRIDHQPRVTSSNPEAVNDNAGDGDTDRLISIESNVKTILSGMDVIVTTMSEVKNRQSSKPFVRADTSVGDPMSVINEFRKLLHEQRPRSCESACNKGGRVDRSERYPTDCHEIQKQGFNVSGIYKIRPDELPPFYVLCDLTTIGGGWTVFQNRYDGSQDFYKGWSDYKYGFGNLAGEFWLGLEKLSYLTNQKLYELRVEVETQHGQEAYAGYSVFTLGPEHEGFRISTLGTYYGTAGDSLSYHSGQKFSTPDMDNDDWKDGSCAAEHGGAWWYKECDKSNLNGKFVSVGEDAKGQSVYWISFKGPNTPLSKTKMMIRPLPATRPAVYNDRKLLESSKMRTVAEKQRNKDLKSNYDMTHPQFRYEDPGQAEAFFPNYGRQ